jgi:hypothetical protein
LGIARIDPVSGELRHAGVGNIGCRVFAHGASQGLVSREGTVGTHLMPPGARALSYGWVPGATLILASDGIRGQWDLRPYPDLLRHDPVVVAATLWRDFARGTDDATVLVVQDTRREG